MDRDTLVTQMKAMKKKAKEAKAAGSKKIAVEFSRASSKLWRKLQRLAPAVAAKIEES